MSQHNEQWEERTFYCQVDTYRATKDYLKNGRCVRLLGVLPEEFSIEGLAQGVTTFSIDIDYWEFCKQEFGLKYWQQVTRAHRELLDGRDNGTEMHSRWYKVQVDFKSHGYGYLYKTFSAEDEKYFSIQSLEELGQGFMPSPGGSPAGNNWLSSLSACLCAPKSSNIPVAKNLQSHCGAQFVFDSFHVGQGMCSLVHDGYTGILLDVGAGKPVTREAYLGNGLTNDLRSVVDSLAKVIAVISHPDSDHWRILAWDTSLRDKVDAIYVPAGASSLAFRDKEIAKKIVGISDQTWMLAKNSSLKLLRSKPSTMDRNGDGLVAVFERDHSRILAAGDYVYERFKTDKNPVIRALHKRNFAGVVVPHHGDAASANGVVASDANAKAFFSAGTHQGYKHPTSNSLNAHKVAKFTNISQPGQTNIVRVNLI